MKSYFRNVHEVLRTFLKRKVNWSQKCYSSGLARGETEAQGANVQEYLQPVPGIPLPLDDDEGDDDDCNKIGN